MSHRAVIASRVRGRVARWRGASRARAVSANPSRTQATVRSLPTYTTSKGLPRHSVKSAAAAVWVRGGSSPW
eukprot:scaffold105835_cov39-Phaeocystis_antarctica.AAC.1